MMAQQSWLNGYTAEVTNAGSGTRPAVAERYFAEGALVAVLGGIDVLAAIAGTFDLCRPLARISFERLERSFDETLAIDARAQLARAALWQAGTR